MAIKRKATSPVRPSTTTPKKARLPGAEENVFDHSRPEERNGVVNRAFYPPEMSNERCAEYNSGTISRPADLLEALVTSTSQQRAKIKPGASVVHWFKRDLRLSDNRALSLASQKAKESNIPLICMYIISPQDYEAHITSARRVDFELRTLEIMKHKLAEMNIPLYLPTVDKRKHVVDHVLQKCEEWGAKHIFCNIEYEVDELRREIKLTQAALKKGIDCTAVHDDVVVSPGSLKSGSGKQYSVYSPWFKSWIRHLHEHPHLLDAFEEPSPNPQTSRKQFQSIFDAPMPVAPKTKTISPEEKEQMAHLFPAGEDEARDRLKRFLDEKIGSYKDTRNFPALNNTSILSVHFSTGTLSARTAVRSARDCNSTKRLDGGNQGIATWISEVAWRDFYKHVLAHWPYVCMNKPFKYEYTDIEWEHNPAHFSAWCQGRTGYPIVDAAMRQLNTIGYMHNRCRMIVGSFLAKDLLLDWRLGEQYFMSQLIDGDFASNNGGWGFSASTGVDPQPYFRIFNPFLQSEKFDADGEYIRKWVPELKGVKGKAIHDPYARGAAREAEKMGYPKVIVDHKVARARALERYKTGLGRGTANVGGGVHN